MFVFGGGFKKEETLFFSILAMLSVVFIISSRGISPVSSGVHDDINVYYSVYQYILSNKFEALFTFGGGVEVGLPLYFYFLSCIFGDITQNQLVLLVNLLIGFLFINWTYKNYQNICQVKYLAFLISGTVLFYSFGYSSLLLRQYISCVFLLYALTEKRRSIAFILMLLAVSFHTSAFLFFVIAKVCLNQKTPLVKMFILSLVVFLAIYFAALIVDIEIVNRNLIYYGDGGAGANFISGREINGFTFKILLLSTIVVIVAELMSVLLKRQRAKFNRYSYFIFLMLFVTIFTMDYAWVPTRAFLIPVFFILPILVFMSMGMHQFRFFQIFIALIFLFRIKTWFLFPDSEISLWVGYSWWGYPFYYIFS